MAPQPRTCRDATTAARSAERDRSPGSNVRLTILDGVAPRIRVRLRIDRMSSIPSAVPDSLDLVVHEPPAAIAQRPTPPAPRGSLASRAARGALWTVISSIGGRAIGVIGTLAMTRFLHPEQIGEVSDAMIIVMTASWVTVWGFGQYSVVERPRGRRRRGHLVRDGGLRRARRDLARAGRGVRRPADAVPRRAARRGVHPRAGVRAVPAAARRDARARADPGHEVRRVGAVERRRRGELHRDARSAWPRSASAAGRS